MIVQTYVHKKNITHSTMIKKNNDEDVIKSADAGKILISSKVARRTYSAIAHSGNVKSIETK